MAPNNFNLSVLRHNREVADDFALLVAGTPASTYNCTDKCIGLLIGTAGTLNVTMRNGHVISALPVPVGFLPGRFASVQTSGTAQNIWEVRG